MIKKDDVRLMGKIFTEKDVILIVEDFLAEYLGLESLSLSRENEQMLRNICDHWRYGEEFPE